MSVALNDSGTRHTDSGGSYVTTRSLTTFTVSAGSDLCLFGIMLTGDGSAITSRAMTWNGVSMTEVATVTNSRGAVAALFRLVAPATGNQTLTASWTTSAAIVLAAVAFSGVDQTTPIDTGHTQQVTGDSTSPSATITCATGDATLAAAFASAGSGTPAFTTPRNQTNLFTSNNMLDAFGEASYALDGASNAHNFTISASSSWGAMGVHIKAAAGGGGGGEPSPVIVGKRLRGFIYS